MVKAQPYVTRMFTTVSPDEMNRDPIFAYNADLGDALLALVAVARENGWDAERALRERLRGLTADVRAAEGGAADLEQ